MYDNMDPEQMRRTLDSGLQARTELATKYNDI